MRPGLAPIQLEVLRVLASLRPRWTLTGGGALAGIYLHHRHTRDLDLFWQGHEELGRLPGEVEATLRAAGFEVNRIETAAAFVRLDVRRGEQATVLDLVADAVAVITTPREWDLGGASIQVDDPHEILVNKLNTLLSRTELRDLVDVEALLATGGDLERALVDASTKDGGFSALTCAWALSQLPVERLGRVAGLTSEATAHLLAFRDALAARLRAAGQPESS